MTAIDVTLTAPLSDARIELFRSILTQLIQVVPIPVEVARIEIKVVPPRSTGTEANRVLGKMVYSELSPAHGALTIPYDKDGNLECVVLIGVEEFDGLTDVNRPDGLIASLVEELLHAQVYGVRWSTQGNFLAVNGGRDDGFQIVASRIHDEYVVSRAKNQIASQVPLFDVPGMPGYRTMRVFSYGGDLSALMAKAEAEVEQLTGAYHEGTLGLAELQTNILDRIAFRKVLDPHSRTFGFADGMQDADRERFVLAPPISALYESIVEPHWQQIHGCLQHSYASHLEASPAMIRNISYEVRTFTQELETQVRPR